MQYIVPCLAPPSLDAIDQALTAGDPAVIVDYDVLAQALRIATVLDESAVADALLDAGMRIGIDDVVRQPSECCGGCGG